MHTAPLIDYSIVWTQLSYALKNKNKKFMWLALLQWCGTKSTVSPRYTLLAKQIISLRVQWVEKSEIIG